MDKDHCLDPDTPTPASKKAGLHPSSNVATAGRTSAPVSKKRGLEPFPMSLSPPRKKAAATPAPRPRKEPCARMQPPREETTSPAPAVTPGAAASAVVAAGDQESGSSDEEMLDVKSDSEEVHAHTAQTVGHTDGSIGSWKITSTQRDIDQLGRMGRARSQA